MGDSGQRATIGRGRGPPVPSDTSNSCSFDINGTTAKFDNMTMSSTNDNQQHLPQQQQVQLLSNGAVTAIATHSQPNGYLPLAVNVSSYDGGRENHHVHGGGARSHNLNSFGGSSSNSGSSSHFDEFKQLLDCQYDSRRPIMLQRVISNPPNPCVDSLKNNFKDVVFELSRDPGAFDNLAPFLVESLNMTEVVHPEVCQDIVSTLVKWAIVSESFRYTGSQLAHYLALPGQLTFNFRNYFLDCVKNECYVKLEKLIGCTSEEEVRLLEGIMLFLSELYVNMGYVTLDESGQHIASNTRLDALKQTLQDSILIILEKAYSDKPLETVGKVLKLTGAALEEYPELRTKADHDKMNRIFTHVDALANADDYTTDKVKVLFRRVLQLRKNLWQSPESPNFANVAPAASSAAAASEPTNDNFLNYDVPVFYLSDGTPIPAHEADFVESDISSDDRFLYLHGEGDIPTSHMSTAAATNDLRQVMSHTLTLEEEEAFNEFLSQMS